MQRQGRDHQVEAGLAERQPLLVRLDPQALATLQHGGGKIGFDQQADLFLGRAGGQGPAEGAVARAEVDGEREAAHDGFQAHHRVFRGAGLQEAGGGKALGRAIQAAAMQGAVEEDGRGGHGPPRWRRRGAVETASLGSCARPGPARPDPAAAGAGSWRRHPDLGPVGGSLGPDPFPRGAGLRRLRRSLRARPGPRRALRRLHLAAPGLLAGAGGLPL